MNGGVRRPRPLPRLPFIRRPRSCAHVGALRRQPSRFCLEFGPRNDAAFREMCLPVIYQPEYPDLDGTGATPEGMPHPLLRLLMTKSEQWRYESEWRMVLHVEAKERIPPATEFQYDPSVLTGVIFGLRMPDDHKQLIRLVTTNFEQLKFYQATRDEASYKIRIVPAAPSPSA